MGGWANRIGHYEVSQMDYYYDGIPNGGQTLEYYKSKTVKVKFRNRMSKQERLIDVPLCELHDFIYNEERGLWDLSWETENKSLLDWLWRKLTTANIKVVTCLILSICGGNKQCPTYYLKSKIGDNDIIITTERVEHEIERLEDIEWIYNMAFYFEK